MGGDGRWEKGCFTTPNIDFRKAREFMAEEMRGEVGGGETMPHIFHFITCILCMDIRGTYAEPDPH